MKLLRFKLTDSYCLGVLKDDVGGTYFTCENAKTLIPEGVYSVVKTYSPKFKTDLPLLFNKEVSGYRGIRIHAGNSSKDSSGCVLVGNTCNLADGTIGDSRRALEQIIRSMTDSLIIESI